jgi:hypothetical protein
MEVGMQEESQLSTKEKRVDLIDVSSSALVPYQNSCSSQFTKCHLLNKSKRKRNTNWAVGFNNCRAHQTENH